MGVFTLTADLKAGKIYTFSSADYLYPLTEQLHRNAQMCIYEEGQDNPHANQSLGNNMRNPASDAVRLSCTPVVIKYEDNQELKGRGSKYFHGSSWDQHRNRFDGYN